MRWIILWACLAGAAEAEMVVLDDLSAPGHWSYVSDQVMGGVSSGWAEFGLEDGRPFARLSGRVSTANNGGFIQIRRTVDGFPPDTTGFLIDARGNGATYYVHLRTDDARRPWQFYQASFTAPEGWSQVSIDLSDFEAKGGGLTQVLEPQNVTSIGLVAYGENYDARLDVARIVLR